MPEGENCALPTVAAGVLEGDGVGGQLRDGAVGAESAEHDIVLELNPWGSLADPGAVGVLDFEPNLLGFAASHCHYNRCGGANGDF